MRPAQITLKQSVKLDPIQRYEPPDMPKAPIKEQQKPEEPTKGDKEPEVPSQIQKDETTKDEKTIDSQQLSQSTVEEQSQPSKQEGQTELSVEMLQPLIFDLNLKLKEFSNIQGGREWQINTLNQQRKKYKVSEEWNMIELPNQKEKKK
ncbi:MAG: hypothetical protein EZS28_016816 [Streblomastix strix]|uniref:Uncharacterized protein n=1 Tax=Streblomastix strix TaxID=222440 RepID=A0A5J4VZJ1_9EUKA|nr:MAG: hypothetical protein EZS28_016816 [Streblomastix strix]